THPSLSAALCSDLYTDPATTSISPLSLHDALPIYARAEGVLILLEPLNRYEDHMVNRLSDAVELVRAVGSDAVRVVADTYHMNIEEDHPASAVLDAAPYLAHVQVSDSNPHQPGAGDLDSASII